MVNREENMKKKIKNEDIILKKVLPKGFSPELAKLPILGMPPYPLFFQKNYEAAILIKEGSYREEGWDIPEGYGIEKLPGLFWGLEDPDLWKIIKERDSN